MLARQELEAVLAPLERARPLPAQAYLDPEVLTVERHAIFDRTWSCIGLAEDVELPGTWIRKPNSRLIALRGEDLVLRAMFDVCVHRGSTLLDGERGRIGRIECPYHGWSYDLSGRLRTQLASFEGARLPAAHVTTMGPLVLVSQVQTELRPWRDLPLLRRVHAATWETRANWKLLGENFQESHHFPRVHPHLEALTPYASSGSRHDEGPWLEGTMELTGETVSIDGSLHGRPRIGRGDERRVHDALLFPTTFLSLQPDYLLVYRLTPLAVDATRVDFDILAHPSVSSMPDVTEFWQKTNAEDRAICERQQIGIASGAWSPRAYDPSEDGTHAFDRKIATALLERA
ncbi:MAG: aromatic ring-hydroxylating oxygenase subunit alpha [Polyangiales bacterium]